MPASVRKTSSALKLRTDASMRFEKSQDPVNTVRGLARAVELLRDVSPGIRLVGGVADVASRANAARADPLPLDWLNRKLGRESAGGGSAPDSGGAAVRRGSRTAAGVFSVTVPSWRATKDISIKDDLVEEVGRMIGYGSITPTVAAVYLRSFRPRTRSGSSCTVLRKLVAAKGFTRSTTTLS